MKTAPRGGHKFRRLLDRLKIGTAVTNGLFARHDQPPTTTTIPLLPYPCRSARPVPRRGIRPEEIGLPRAIDCARVAGYFGDQPQPGADHRVRPQATSRRV